MDENIKLPESQAHAGTVAALAQSAAIMAHLRGPHGCPWDREQTFDSIQRHTLEETYEVFDAIDRRDWPALRDELGDLLLQVLFYAQMADDAGHFNLRDVAEGLNAKLIRRHPHVFGDAVAKDANSVLVTWEGVKQQEKLSAAVAVTTSLLDEVPRAFPALLEAQKIGRKAAGTGFDWPDASGLFAKLDEEIAELMVEVEAGKREAGSREGIAEEFGDLLFTAVNLGRHLGLDAETSLRAANGKFRRRFAAMEQNVDGALEGRTIEELEALWTRAKAAEKSTEENA